MANFDQSAARVLKLEGGYQSNPSDKGNYNSLRQNVGTNYGVSARLYEDWIGRPPSLADMKAITKALALRIYRERFWNKINGDAIRDQALAELVFDGAINHGVYRSLVLLQEVLGVPTTGAINSATLTAINSRNAASVYNAYRQRRIKFYNSLVAADPSQGVFLKGWLSRMEQFKDYVASKASSFGLFLSLLAGGYIIYKYYK